MKLIEDSNGMFPSEFYLVPVCSQCGCRQLYKQAPGIMYRLKNCPKCDHILNWNKEKDSGGKENTK